MHGDGAGTFGSKRVATGCQKKYLLLVKKVTAGPCTRVIKVSFRFPVRIRAREKDNQRLASLVMRIFEKKKPGPFSNQKCGSQSNPTVLVGVTLETKCTKSPLYIYMTYSYYTRV